MVRPTSAAWAFTVEDVGGDPGDGGIVGQAEHPVGGADRDDLAAVGPYGWQVNITALPWRTLARLVPLGAAVEPGRR